jgi:hypothetical protein
VFFVEALTGAGSGGGGSRLVVRIWYSVRGAGGPWKNLEAKCFGIAWLRGHDGAVISGNEASARGSRGVVAEATRGINCVADCILRATLYTQGP